MGPRLRGTTQWLFRQHIQIDVIEIAGHHCDGDGKSPGGFRQHGDDRPRAYPPGARGENEHRNVDVLVDDIENLFARVAFRGSHAPG